MIKTKQELLNHFSDINTMYNNPFMYQTLSNMIDELFVQQPYDDCVLDKIRAEIIQMPTISLNANDIYKADVLAIIDKYKRESEAKK